MVALLVFMLGGSWYAEAQKNNDIIDDLLLSVYYGRNPDPEWDSESIIYGRDGSILIGRQLGVANEKIIFRLNSFDTIRVPLRYIKSIKGPGEVIIYQNGKYHYRSNYFLLLTNGYALGYNFSGQINAMAGLRFGGRYAAGLGVGYESHESDYAGLYLWDDFNTWYGYGRYYINDARRRLYADAKLGYGFPVNSWDMDSQTGGVLIQPGIGVIRPGRKHVRWTYSFSYCFQHSSGTQVDRDTFGSPINTEYEIWFRRLIFTFGIEIN